MASVGEWEVSELLSVRAPLLFPISVIRDKFARRAERRQLARRDIALWELDVPSSE
jgi:hypothetical protein